MRAPSYPSLLAAASGEPNPADAPAPANRAARRGRAGKPAPGGAVHAGSSGRARAAQGRRIIPVRRTG